MEISYLPTLKRKPRQKPITLVVIHYTASSLESALYTFGHETYPNGSKCVASVHFVIGRSGKLIQMASLESTTNHAGESYWKGQPYCNQYSIGIELENMGYLTLKDGKYITYVGTPISQSNVAFAPDGKPWHAYTKEQIDTAIALCWTLKSLSSQGAPFQAELLPEDFVGHQDIAPGRKVDPGPCFPFQELRDSLSTCMNPLKIAVTEQQLYDFGF